MKYIRFHSFQQTEKPHPEAGMFRGIVQGHEDTKELEHAYTLVCHPARKTVDEAIDDAKAVIKEMENGKDY